MSRWKAKPCPFCGCEDVGVSGCLFFVTNCYGCRVEGPRGKTATQARRAWNRRK